MELIEKLKVDPYQLFLLKMMFEAEENRIPIYKTAGKLKKIGMLDLDALADLVTRDVVIDYNKTGISGPAESFIDDYELSPKALRLMTTSFLKARELMKNYPRLLEINGKKYNIVNIGEAELSLSYQKNLEITETEHEEVLELLEWGKENKCVNIGLKKFAETQYWLTLKEMKENGTQGIVGSVSIEML